MNKFSSAGKIAIGYRDGCRSGYTAPFVRNLLFKLLLFPPNGSYVMCGQDRINVPDNTEVLMVPGPAFANMLGIEHCHVYKDTDKHESVFEFWVHGSQKEPESNWAWVWNRFVDIV